MSSERTFTWEFLKNIAETLDSYRVRALIDAKDDILKAQIYNESQYNNILFKIFDEERLKYELYDYLKTKSHANFAALEVFSQQNSIDVKKTYSLLNLLANENLIDVKEITEEIKGEEGAPSRFEFKGLSIQTYSGDISEIKAIYEPVKVIFDSNTCSGCGMCAGICPVNCLNVYNGFGKIDEDKCIRCGLCYFVCPRSYLPVRVFNMYQEDTSEIKEYSNVGHFIEAYSARTNIDSIKEKCQDGGITSTCIYYLLDSQKVDMALGAKMSNTIWRPDPLLLKTKEEVLQTAGTKYVNNPTLRVLNQKELLGKKLAIAGVPCMMQAMLKSQIYPLGIPSLSNIEYKIGIFCMESFPYQGFLKICEILKVDVNNVKKTDINKGKFFIHTNSGEELSIAIKDISHLARVDCEVCFDLTSESADISVGSIGSPSGWNTVLIRTEKGKTLFRELVSHNLIESKKIEEVKPGLSLLQKIAGTKKANAKKHISHKKENKERYPKY